MTDLPKIANQLPQLEDVIIDGTVGLLGYLRKVYKKGEVEYNQEDDPRSLLLAGRAGRAGAPARPDESSRASLYDAWRQIRVTANALRGVFNVTLTNQFLTPPTTTNPFAFLEQAKQFSLVINAELPLVRLAERNNFRTALITYQRQRRTLMNSEDFTKFQVRQDIRNMQTQYLTYEINRRNLVLTDPPEGPGVRADHRASGRGRGGDPGQPGGDPDDQPDQLPEPAADARKHARDELAAVSTRSDLTLYRDLGIMPYDEWEAFHELFPAEPINRDGARRRRRETCPRSSGRPGGSQSGGKARGTSGGGRAGRRRGGRSAFPGVSKSVKELFAATEVEIINFPVKPAHLPVTVVERGILESSENEDVFCQVEGSTTIISILPEGTRVTKGQLVCELDSSALQDNLKNQKIATLGAEAAYENAKLTREVAEIAVVEYVEGIYKQEFETVQGEIALADAERKRAEDRIVWSDRMFEKGYVSKAQNIADKVSLQQKVFAFEQAQTKKTVLEKYTRDKTIKELQSEVEKAKSDELAKQQTWELEKDKEAKLEKQIKNCKLFAPGDGIVVYANDPSRVRRQPRCRSRRGRPSASGRRSSAFPTSTRCGSTPRSTSRWSTGSSPASPPGSASMRSPRRWQSPHRHGRGDRSPARPDSFFSSDIKVYTTHVTIDKGLPGLRPGMSAQVEILVTELDNVLSVPVQAIIEFKGKDHVAVKTADRLRVARRSPSASPTTSSSRSRGAQDRRPRRPEPGRPDVRGREARRASARRPRTRPRRTGATPPRRPPTRSSASDACRRQGRTRRQGRGRRQGQGARAKGQGKGEGRRLPSKMDPAVREKFKNASPEEKRKILEDAGMPADRIERMIERRRWRRRRRPAVAAVVVASAARPVAAEDRERGQRLRCQRQRQRRAAPSRSSGSSM